MGWVVVLGGWRGNGGSGGGGEGGVYERAFWGQVWLLLRLIWKVILLLWNLISLRAFHSAGKE